MVGGFCSTVDHLVNNAGVIRFELFEDSIQFSDYASIMVKIETNMVAFLSHFCNKVVLLIALERRKSNNVERGIVNKRIHMIFFKYRMP